MTTKRLTANSCGVTLPRGESVSVTGGGPSRPQGQQVRGNTHVFVLDKNHKPLMPCHPARARELLRKGRAVVVRIYPMVIRLKDRVGGETQLVRVKIDPGSKTTGIALVREDAEKNLDVLFLAELVHRGSLIRDRLSRRASYRHGRRSRNLRYRAPRFSNRTKPKDWLPPSLRHRVETTVNWVQRLRKWAPVTNISMELVKFDLQKMENQEIAGVEYQQGTLFGYETREYLLEKFDRTCVYCDATGVPLQMEHVVPKVRGGSDRVSNLVIACEKCNNKKSAKPVELFLKNDQERLKKIFCQLKKPLADAAAVNSTRNALCRALSALLPTETGSGGRTKWNRTRLGLPKTHALDAVCVGDTSRVDHWRQPVLNIKCNGRGSYRRTRTTAYGLPCGYLMRSKSVSGFTTGDIVKAVVEKGKNTGVHIGRIAIRARGSFDLKNSGSIVISVYWKRCTKIQRADGYGYSVTAAPPTQPS